MSFEYTNIDNLNVNTINNNPYPPTKISTVTTLTNSTATITAAQLVGGIINCVGYGNGYTLDTSANITAAFNPTIVGQIFQVLFSTTGNVAFSSGDSNTNLFYGARGPTTVIPPASTIAHFAYTGTGWNVYFYSVNID